MLVITLLSMTAILIHTSDSNLTNKNNIIGVTDIFSKVNFAYALQFSETKKKRKQMQNKREMYIHWLSIFRPLL